MVVELSRELLVAAKHGDRRAYERVGMWMADALLTFYLGQGRSVEVAQELSQKTAEDLVKKFEHAPEDPEAFRSLVIRFAMTMGRQHKTDEKRRANKRAAAYMHPRTPARRPESLLAYRRLLAWVRAELRKLPSPYRHTLDLALERDNYGQIADELDVPQGTVQRRIWQIRRLLRSGRRRGRRTSKRYRS